MSRSPASIARLLELTLRLYPYHYNTPLSPSSPPPLSALPLSLSPDSWPSSQRFCPRIYITATSLEQRCLLRCPACLAALLPRRESSSKAGAEVGASADPSLSLHSGLRVRDSSASFGYRLSGSTTSYRCVRSERAGAGELEQRRRRADRFAPLHDHSLYSLPPSIFTATLTASSPIRQLIFQAVGLSSFYLAFFFLCSAAVSDSDDDPFGGVGSEVISVANSVYIATLGVTIVCGELPSLFFRR